MKEFFWKIRVYYEDTDTGGVVYHSQYLNFYERARSEMLRFIGISQESLLKQHVAFVVTQLCLSYIKAARLDALLTVVTEVKQIKKASITFIQKIRNEKNELISQATVEVACIDTIKMRPMRLPEELTTGFMW